MIEPAQPAADVRLEQLTVRYGRATAVDAVSLAVAPGEVYALVGRNGAGKSSLLRVLLGQQRAAAGRSWLFGHDSWRGRAAALAEVGVVPEEPDAPSDSTPQELAAFCARLYPRWDARRFAERLGRFAVPRERPFGRLSKGQKTQVALALALAAQPRLLVLDDPTLGLDAVARREVLDELIAELADRGTTVLLASHELGAVQRLAARVGVLDHGRLLLDEDLDALRGRWRRLRLPRLEQAAVAELRERLEPWRPGPARATAWGSEILLAAFSDEGEPPDGLGPLAAAAEPLSFEEIFLVLVGEDDERSVA